jgi:hypothetical protein
MPRIWEMILSDGEELARSRKSFADASPEYKIV